MKKLLLISGNSSIGPEIIKEFLNKNYKVITTYNKKKIILKKSRLYLIKLNINDEKDIRIFIKKISKIKFDCAIFCTGILLGQKFLDYTINDAKNVFNINFFSIINLFSLLLKNFKKNASVFFISSISSERGSFDPYYAASKAALNMMVKNLAKDLAKKIRIIAVSPSLIENSKMYYDMTKKNRVKHLKKNPQKSLVKKKDIAKILLSLSLNHWKKLNGINLNLNGGL